MLIATVTMQK